MTTLTPRQERFCQRFVYCLNAAKAACAAGYAPRTANQQGYRLLRDPRIGRRIQNIQMTLAEQHGRDTDVLVGKLEMVYRRAMDDRRYDAAARAVALQAELTNPRPGPHRLWRDLAHAAAANLRAAERQKSAAPAGEAAGEAAGETPGETPGEAPGAADGRLKAVGA